MYTTTILLTPVRSQRVIVVSLCVCVCLKPRNRFATIYDHTIPLTHVLMHTMSNLLMFKRFVISSKPNCTFAQEVLSLVHFDQPERYAFFTIIFSTDDIVGPVESYYSLFCLV